MNFKVGQRVKIVGALVCVEAIGREATILTPLHSRTCISRGRTYWGYDVEVDGLGRMRGLAAYCFEPHCLAPLTDPRADAFIESIKKLAREPRIPVTTPAFGD